MGATQRQAKSYTPSTPCHPAPAFSGAGSDNRGLLSGTVRADRILAAVMRPFSQFPSVNCPRQQPMTLGGSCSLDRLDGTGRHEPLERLDATGATTKSDPGFKQFRMPPTSTTRGGVTRIRIDMFLFSCTCHGACNLAGVNRQLDWNGPEITLFAQSEGYFSLLSCGQVGCINPWGGGQPIPLIAARVQLPLSRESKPRSRAESDDSCTGATDRTLRVSRLVNSWHPQQALKLSLRTSCTFRRACVMYMSLSRTRTTSPAKAGHIEQGHVTTRDDLPEPIQERESKVLPEETHALRNTTTWRAHKCALGHTSRWIPCNPATVQGLR